MHGESRGLGFFTFGLIEKAAQLGDIRLGELCLWVAEVGGHGLLQRSAKKGADDSTERALAHLLPRMHWEINELPPLLPVTEMALALQDGEDGAQRRPRGRGLHVLRDRRKRGLTASKDDVHDLAFTATEWGRFFHGLNFQPMAARLSMPRVDFSAYTLLEAFQGGAELGAFFFELL